MSGKFSCIIAALALILMIITIISNALYIKDRSEHILQLTDQAMVLDDRSAIAISEICNYWNQSAPIFKFSVSQEEIEEIDLILNEIQICAESGEGGEYKRSMARLRRAIESITKREEFSLENIF